MKRSLTGIKPTNILHLGNYFGALLPALRMQDEYHLSMMIADLHAITVPQNPAELAQNSAFVAATYLAAGIDPKKTCLFQQSAIAAHTELAWMLNCVARMGEVERMTQYKDKSTVKGEQVSVGLFTYPILMAADILLYDTDVVPVGADQKQHVELARDLAERFNRDFGPTFTVPQPVIREEGARILGLDDPTKKMSKSAPSPKNYLSLLDDTDTIVKKIKSAVTDSLPTITADPARAGVHNLLTLFALIEGGTVEGIALRYADSGMAQFKADLAEAVTGLIIPLQGKITHLLTDKEYLGKVVAEGNSQAELSAARKAKQAKRAMGLFLG